MLDAPLITALVSDGREKRRDVPLAAIPPQMIQAVLAIEDRRFYDHPGVDLIGTSARGLHQSVRQPAVPERRQHAHPAAGEEHVPDLDVGPGEGAREGSAPQVHRVAHVDRARAPADQGQGPRALSERRPARAARLVRHPRRPGSGAAVLRQGRQQPQPGRSRDHRRRDPGAVAALARSPIPSARKERRNVVLQAMAETGFIIGGRRRARVAGAGADRRSARSSPRRRTSSTTSPRRWQERTKATGAVDVYSTLDLHLQRIAQDAVRDGLDPGRRDPRQAQAALAAGGAHRHRSAHRRNPRDGRRPLLQPVAVQPRHQRQAAAGLGVQAVRLPRRVRARRRPTAAPTSRRRRSSSTSRPTFTFNDQPWTPSNYDERVRRADHAAARARAVAQHRDHQGRRVDRLRQRRGVLAQVRHRHAPKGYPSIALGVFEATPFEIATAYTVFPNGGTIRPLARHRPHRRRRQGPADRRCRR